MYGKTGHFHHAAYVLVSLIGDNFKPSPISCAQMSNKYKLVRPGGTCPLTTGVSDVGPDLAVIGDFAANSAIPGC